jgi:putative membrane protein
MLSLSTTILASDWHHGGPGWWIVFPLFWIVVIATVILFLRSRSPRVGHGETALDLLDARYARGEIDLDEYRDRRAVLKTNDTR